MLVLTHGHPWRACISAAAVVAGYGVQNMNNARKTAAMRSYKGRDAMAALRHVEDLRKQNKFRGDVYGPISLEVRGCVGGCTGGRVWVAQRSVLRAA